MDPQIAPWLSVADATMAVDYYKAAFGAVELHRMEGAPGTVEVAQLSIGPAQFWVQHDTETDPHLVEGRSPVRMILTVDDPDTVFAQAIAAGARQINPVEEGHGWRVGRLADPAGHHWEVGKPLEVR